jgi:trimeric autotransporter adhesin
VININQVPTQYLALGTALTEQVANPFFGLPSGQGKSVTSATIQRRELLRPYPQFGDILMRQSTQGLSQYHAAVLKFEKRVSNGWGGRINYTYSRLNDNQFGESNYYSSAPGLQNNYTVVPGSSYSNPEQEYGRSLLDSPHKVVIAPTLMLPFGQGKRFLSDSRIGGALLGGWSITPAITLQAGFPLGVSQNVTGTAFLYGGTLRPNIVPGTDILTAGAITDRITASTTDNLYYNKAAFASAPLNGFGNAPRTLGVYSPWRNNVDLSVSKQVKTGGVTALNIRLEVLNMFNIVQWAAPASSAFGNSSFGQITSQANNMRMLQFTLRFQF